MATEKPHLNLIFIGHIDHGKSTLVGRMFFETGSLSQQELEKFKKLGKQFKIIYI
jgi:elongation factor 1-alpha